MSAKRGPRRGDVVQIRSAEEIMATVDDEGRVDGMPFMPEMLQFAGRTFTVNKRADKTCDTIHSTGLRRLHDTVLLADLRCDGESHGGCQAGCPLFWKEAWLKRPDEQDSDRSPRVLIGAAPPAASRGRTVEQLRALTTVAAPLPATPAAERFRCQATEMFDATSALHWWEPTQYVRDVRSGNVSVVAVALGFIRWLSVRVQARLNGSGVPGVKGRLKKTPRQVLELQPGERVRVKTKREIQRTLDTANRNRNLSFDAEMLRYCGHEFTVLRRVSQIIDERTGEMIHIPGDCITLDGVTCRAEYRLFCPRGEYAYWREAWLSRVEDETAPQVSGTPVSRQS